MSRSSYSDNKKSRATTLLLYILLAVSVIVFLVAGIKLLYELVIAPKMMQENVDEIRSELSDAFEEVEEESSEEISSEESEEVSATSQSGSLSQRSSNYCAAIQKLQKKYPELVGWISFEGTDIDFPVMQSSENYDEYYLRRDYKGEYSEHGSVFLSSYNQIDGDIQILFGHSMMDGTMFASLVDYGDPEVLAENPTFIYDTANEPGVWKIVSVFKTNTYLSQGEPFDYVVSGFGSEEQKMEFIYDSMIRSMVDTGVSVNENDDLILLSTCSYELEGFRTVVVARRCREGESIKMDSSLITANEAPLYPAAWYNTFGGYMPSYENSFYDALANGNVDWYDGNIG